MREKLFVFLASCAFLTLTLSHIPVVFFPEFFDKNAPAQFVVLCLIAVVFALILLFRVRRIDDSSVLPLVAMILFASVGISVFTSGDVTGSMIGDVSRFTGAMSLAALSVVGYFHFTFAKFNYLGLIKGYLLGVTIFQVVGFLEFFQIVDIPNTGGFSSTLGNLDFYSAMVGTSFPLYFLLLTERSRKNLFFFIFGAIASLVSLWLNGAKQGIVDVVLFSALIIAFPFRRRISAAIKADTRSLNALAWMGSLAIFLWIQAIFLVPFLDLNIPGVSDDVNVVVRGQYWSAALNIFAEHPLIGVGPDQYGNYYEKYRAVESVLLTQRVVSNDAHSSLAQTFATLGTVGTLVFILLNYIVIRSWVIAMRRAKSTALWIFIAYYIIYITNSMISPITLPNKFLFWSICGLIVGLAYKDRVSTRSLITVNRTLVFTLLLMLIPLISWHAYKFTYAQVTYMSKLQDRFDNPNKRISLVPNDYLPCAVYYFGLLTINGNEPLTSQLEMAEKQIELKPRCNFAILNLFSYELSRKDYKAAEKYVPLLIEQAPTRGEVLEKLASFARATGDRDLLAKVIVQADKLGLLVKQESQELP